VKKINLRRQLAEIGKVTMMKKKVPQVVEPALSRVAQK
jgi:hypothetical protein